MFPNLSAVNPYRILLNMGLPKEGFAHSMFNEERFCDEFSVAHGGVGVVSVLNRSTNDAGLVNSNIDKLMGNKTKDSSIDSKLFGYLNIPLIPRNLFSQLVSPHPTFLLRAKYIKDSLISMRKKCSSESEAATIDESISRIELVIKAHNDMNDNFIQNIASKVLINFSALKAYGSSMFSSGLIGSNNLNT
jgi:hypothetical protein